MRPIHEQMVDRSLAYIERQEREITSTPATAIKYVALFGLILAGLVAFVIGLAVWVFRLF
jgi:hypothetical protein